MQGRGRFIKKNGNGFRTVAELKWGNSDRLLGIVVLMNPGRAKLKHASEKRRLQCGEGEVESELTIDSAMHQIEKIVIGMYGEADLGGKVLLYNLFPLCESKHKDAIAKFNMLWELQEPLVQTLPLESEELKQEIQAAEWVLFGWGPDCRKNHRLYQKMREWHMLAREVETPILGIQEGGVYSYKLINPSQVQEQEHYQLHVIDQYMRLPRLADGKRSITKFFTQAARPNIVVSESMWTENIQEDVWQRTCEHPLHYWHGPYIIPQEKILQYSQLMPRPGVTLVKYCYRFGYQGPAVIYAVPETAPIKITECERVPVKDMNSIPQHFPRPFAALPDIMDAITGDRSPLSYLQAAFFHCQLRGQDIERILPNDNKEHRKIDFAKVPEEAKWNMYEEEPLIWEPHFYVANDGSPTVVLYTHNPYMPESIQRWTYRFSGEGYRVKGSSEVIARGSGGYVA